MNVSILALTLAALAGLLMAIQGTLNAMLSKAVGLLETTFIVSLLGVVLSGALLLFGLGSGNFSRYPTVPWYAFLGGFIGVGIVYAVASAIAKTNAAPATTAIVLAQVSTAAVLDHFGIFGLRQVSLTWAKGFGIILLAASTYMVLRQQ